MLASRFPLMSLSKRSQRGAILLVMLVIMVIGALALFVSSLSSSTIQISRDKETADALAKAKEALIGYAVTYGDTHPNQVNGLLPVPDLGTSRNLYPGEGNTAGNFSGNSANLSVIGRLPWLALDVPPLKDGNGECLWYAVSGTFQNAQQTNFVNWDTVSQFDAYTSDGTSSGTISTTGTNYHQRPVAIIFSAGPALPGQDRAASATDTVTSCSGNYDARNYLDTFNANTLLNSIVNYFSGSTNNSTGTFTLAIPKQFVIGPVSDTSQTPPLVLANDKFLTITSDDIFRIIKKRNDFGAFVSSLLTDAATCMSTSTYPNPVTINFDTLSESLVSTATGSLLIGRMPNTAFTGAGACAGVTYNATRYWRDNLLYAVCTPLSACLTVNGATCKGIIIFAGERTSSQTRATNAQKNAPWGNYLEGFVLTDFSSGNTTISGASSYSVASPSTDVLQCIT
jgi:type II secretory pathway pseudopilin PulG